MYIQRRFLLLTVILLTIASFALVITGPAYAQEEPTSSLDVTSFLTSQEFSVDINPDALAYAFEWNKGGYFEFKTNGSVNEYEHIEEMTDGPENLSNKSISELYYINESETQIFIKNSSASELKIKWVWLTQPQKDKGDQRISSNNLTNPTHVNLDSGANYSTLPIVSRSMWGANEESSSVWPPEYKAVERFIIHHTVITNSNFMTAVQLIYNYHTYTNGWGDIGYNYLIDPNGVIYEGRKGGDNAIGAHAYMQNGRSMGISFIGDFSYVLPSNTALASFRSFIAEKSILHGIPLVWGETVFGHRDMPENSTACPGNAFYAALPTIISEANSVRANLSSGTLSQAYASMINNTNNYYDNRLTIKFVNSQLTENEALALLPKNSGITDVDYANGEAFITFESFTWYGGEYFDDTLDRVKFAYLIFLLDPNIQSIELAPEGPYDYGDAPETYSTSTASHLRTAQSPYFGSGVDGEESALVDTAATGDDNRRTTALADDEDGVSYTELRGGFTGNITLSIGAAGYVKLWVDFGNDGTFAEASDKVYDGYLEIGLHEVDVAVPQTISQGTTFARARISSQNTFSYNDAAIDGEVEDIRVWIHEWSDLFDSVGNTNQPVATQKFGDKYFQVLSSNTWPYVIYVRNSSDGHNWTQWSAELNGYSHREPSLAIFQNRLYLSVSGTDNRIYTKSMDMGGTWDSKWAETGGTTLEGVGIGSGNLNGTEMLFQIVKSSNDTNIYVRQTKDGVFDYNSPEEKWKIFGGFTNKKPSLSSINGKLIATVAGTDSRIYLRTSIDGVNWSNWAEKGGLTFEAPVISLENNLLYQTVKSIEDNSLYYRSTSDLQNWTPWKQIKINADKAGAIIISNSVLGIYVPSGSLLRYSTSVKSL